MDTWYQSHQTLVEVAGWLIDRGDLVNALDVFGFFEKPWKWEPEYQEYLADRVNR